MAKQRGIHQLKGKVGEMSYYQQKGVSGGLVRRINEGLSSRVKVDDAYANTRLNNAEFKNANAIASAAFKSVPNRYRGMLRTFAVANMTKRALEDIKQGSGQWGVRLPFSNLDVLMCDMLENYAKGGAYSGEFGTYTVSAIDNTGVATLSINIPVETQLSMKEQGIDAIQLVSARCLAGEIMVDDQPRLFAGHGLFPMAPITIGGTEEITQSGTLSFNMPSFVGMSPSGYAFAQQDENHGFFVVCTILPLRRVGSQQYVLQELCTYVAFPLGQIPE